MSTGDSDGFLYSHGVMTDLGTLGGLGSGSFAYSINNAGQVVGESWNLGRTNSHAFLYSHGVMTDLGTLGGSITFALGINAAGQVVGQSLVCEDRFSAFLYSGGTMINLNSSLPPDSGWHFDTATAINDSGQIVGQGTHNGEYHAFLLNPVPEPRSFLLVCTAIAGLSSKKRRAQNQLRRPCGSGSTSLRS
jgi:probable HAF family extracellular repeat protein